VRSYGADHFFDYSDPEVITKIKAITPDLQYAFDTIGNPTNSTTAAECIAGKGRLCTVRPGKMYTEGVKKEIEVSDVMVWTGLGMEVRYGEAFWPVSQEDQYLTAQLFRNIPEWYGEGRFRGNRTKVLKGLESVERGFQMFRDAEISGFKVVYAI
jgi:NADPH:quinone reductase-like Zn-dependent oxidoreductase